MLHTKINEPDLMFQILSWCLHNHKKPVHSPRYEEPDYPRDFDEILYMRGILFPQDDPDIYVSAATNVDQSKHRISAMEQLVSDPRILNIAVNWFEDLSYGAV